MSNQFNITFLSDPTDLSRIQCNGCVFKIYSLFKGTHKLAFSCVFIHYHGEDLKVSVCLVTQFGISGGPLENQFLLFSAGNILIFLHCMYMSQMLYAGQSARHIVTFFSEF